MLVALGRVGLPLDLVAGDDGRLPARPRRGHVGLPLGGTGRSLPIAGGFRPGNKGADCWQTGPVAYWGAACGTTVSHRTCSRRCPAASTATRARARASW